MSARRTAIAALAGTLALTLVTPVAASADSGGTSYEWVGNTTGSGGDGHSWTDTRNWSPQGLPGADDRVQVSPPQTGCSVAVDGVPAGTEISQLFLAERGSGSDICHASLAGGALTVTGDFIWHGGDLAAPVTTAKDTNFMIVGSEAGPMYLGADLVVGGRLLLTGLTTEQRLVLERPAGMRIAATGSVEAQGENTIGYTACCLAPAHLVNEGTLQVQNGTLRIEGVQLDQRGTVDFTRGTLLTRAAPATAAPGARYTGSGTWQLGESGYPTRLSGVQHLGSDVRLRLGGVDAGSSETLGGSFTLAGTGVFDWAGGVLAADATIARTVRVVVDGARNGNDARQLGGVDYSGTRPVPVRFTNHGTMALTRAARIDTADQARIVNAATGRLTLTAGTALRATRCCTAPDRVENRGGVVLDGRASLAGLDYVQAAGRTDVRNGAFPAVYRLFHDGGVVTGVSAVRGTLVNRGVALAPGAGRIARLQVGGSYTQAGRGALVLDVARRNRDTVTVGGAAAVGGRIVTRGYVPRVGGRVTVLTAARGIARQRVCVATSGKAARTRHWTIGYRGNSLQLVVRKGRAPRC